MAVSTIKHGNAIYREVQHAYTIAANGSYNTNLKTIIDADMPADYNFDTIVGYSTNNANVVAYALYYADTAYTLRLKNLTNAAVSSTNIRIQYKAVPK